jgi:predicted metallopeptidase
MKYEFAPDIQKIAEDICDLMFPHVQINNIKCYRSYGSSSKYTIARCHALGKIMQNALGRKAMYVLEFLSGRFDKLEEEERIKVIMHELMHIPKSFGGGFKFHDFVTERNVGKYYLEYKRRKKEVDRNEI